MVKIAITTRASVQVVCSVSIAPRATPVTAKVRIKTRQKEAKAAALEPVERKAVTGVGAPS
jgi:hypothetical protein